MNDASFLITGANGQLGRALQKQYPKARTVDIDTLDISSPADVDAYDWTGITTILNAAAYTNVDGAESEEGRKISWLANAVAVANLTRVAISHDITIVHISSDYVFDGEAENHTEDEQFSPLSVYGASKAAGDIALASHDKHYIIRTSWVIGEGKNFVRTMLDLGQKGVAPHVVNDQIGRLTFTSELVRAIDHLLKTNASFGTYNVTNSGDSVSWADVTAAIFELAGFSQNVTGISTEQYFEGKTGIAPRPHYSTLSLDKITKAGFKSRDWREDLAAYIKQELAS